MSPDNSVSPSGILGAGPQDQSDLHCLPAKNKKKRIVSSSNRKQQKGGLNSNTGYHEDTGGDNTPSPMNESGGEGTGFLK